MTNAIEVQKRMAQLRAQGASGQEIADYAEEIAAEAHESARRTARGTYGVGAAVALVMAVGLLAAGVSALLGAGAVPGGTAAGFGVGALVMGIFTALLTRNVLALRPPPKELVTTGVPARLQVRDYRHAPGGFRLQSNGSSVDFRRVAIDLDVSPAEGAPYQVTVREYLAGRAFVKLAPNATLVGYVDRTDPARIFIDWRAKA